MADRIEQKDAADKRRPRGRPRAFHDKSEQNTIKSLDRAITVLETLAELEGATLSALARALDQSPATVYRILSTLEAHELVQADPAAQSWHIGPGAFRIGSVFLRRTSLVERARPVMRDLMEATGETANLGVARGDQVLFVSQVESHQTIRAFFPPGTLSPFHASGVGKALAGEMDDARLERLVRAAPRDRFTAKTIVAPEALLTDLRAARSRGYAFDDEERNEGMRCIASPVFNATGEAAAGISVSGPTSRIGLAEVDDIAAQVTQAAKALSESLGAPAALLERRFGQGR